MERSKNKTHGRTGFIGIRLYLFLLALIVLPQYTQAAGNTYYIATDGSDSNPGTLAKPWQTIGKANQELQAGDTVIIREGTYDEIIEPFNSGSEGQKITYKAYSGETVYIKGESGVYPAISIGWKVHGNSYAKSYIVIDGFNVSLTNPSKGAPHIWIHNGTNGPSIYNEVRNCAIEAPIGSDDGPFGISLSRGDYNVLENNCINGGNLGIHVVKDAQYSIIRGNTVVNSYWSNMVIGGNSGIIQGMLIENNKFYDTFGEDGIQFESSSGRGPDDYHNKGVIIRNNEFWNNGENAIDLKGVSQIVIEGNIIHEGIGSNDGGHYGWNRGSWPGGIMRGSGSKSRDIIIRNNILYDNHGGIRIDPGYKIYNNVLVANNRDYTGPNSSWESPRQPRFAGIHLWSGYSRIGIKNNIIGGHNSAELIIITGAEVNINNNLYFDGKFVEYRGTDNWDYLPSFAAWKSHLAGLSGISGADSNSLEDYPLFVNVPNDPVGQPDLFDFHLKSGSPCIDSGTSLTKTTNSGSGTQISAEDAGYFCDGFGITEGDLIQVGSNSPVRITNVDYDNNKITVKRSISWNKGDGVSLPYSGSHPDIGAYEFGNALIPKSKD